MSASLFNTSMFLQLNMAEIKLHISDRDGKGSFNNTEKLMEYIAIWQQHRNEKR